MALRDFSYNAPVKSASPSSNEAKPQADEFSGVMLSPEVRAELLDPPGWMEALDSYAATTKLAVALTNSRGRLLGTCRNPQSVWELAHRQLSGESSPCSFCLSPRVPCTAVGDALRTGEMVMARDLAGLSHVAVPLSLGGEPVGALIAGQVFTHYPDPLHLQRVAREAGISAQILWKEATRLPPVSERVLRVYGELLRAFGTAFLRQRYGAIVDRRLIETNHRYRLFIEGVKDYALYTVNLAGCVSSWNAGAERLFGYAEAEILGQDFARLFTPEDIERGIPERELQIESGGGRKRGEGWRVRKDGSRFLSSGVLSVVGEGEGRELGKLVHDITDQRRAETALLEAQKLESIGVLAGGIAHDFNNLLVGILGGITMAKEGLTPGHPACRMLEIAERSSEKAAELIRQLLAYVGKGRNLTTSFDLSVLIAETMALIETSVPKNVRLVLQLGPDLPPIEGDASQIRQIVMNLVINGAEAAGPDGGSLRVSTSLQRTADADGKSKAEVCFEVEDDGSGMSEDTRARIFDPFFTTKFAGRGLGLAAVSGIVRAHQGRMEVESVLGQGSLFRIYLPASSGVAAAGKKTADPETLHGSGRILVVDDEPLVRELAAAVLEQFGYSVLLAENGLEGVQIFRENAETITTVLLDLSMPGIGGEEAFRLIRHIDPAVPVIICSGYSTIAVGEQFADGVVQLMQKPYNPVELAEKVQAALRAKRAPDPRTTSGEPDEKVENQSAADQKSQGNIREQSNPALRQR